MLPYLEHRGRVKELLPPDARSQQKLQEVAGAPRSGGSSKKWRKLDQVGEKKEKRKREKEFSQNVQKYISKKHKKYTHNLKKLQKERHNLKTSTNVHLQNDCCVALQYLRPKPIFRHFFYGRNGSRSSSCMHHHKRVVRP